VTHSPPMPGVRSSPMQIREARPIGEPKNKKGVAFAHRDA
jgi:hypothetical protein